MFKTSEDSVFRILGPIMTGPSSSHTAGAVRIGRTARLLYGKQPKKATIYFHGSFAETWKGHGSDKAIISGLLGFKTFDERIKEADAYAKESSLEVIFKKIDLGPDYHPNTIKIVIDEEQTNIINLIAESIGGGDIIIREIMGYKTEITGEYATIILRHKDFIGLLSKITGVISEENINILSLKSKDIPYMKEGMSIIEINQNASLELLAKLANIKGMLFVRALPKLAEEEEVL